MEASWPEDGEQRGPEKTAPNDETPRRVSEEKTSESGVGKHAEE